MLGQHVGRNRFIHIVGRRRNAFSDPLNALLEGRGHGFDCGWTVQFAARKLWQSVFAREPLTGGIDHATNLSDPLRNFIRSVRSRLVDPIEQSVDGNKVFVS